MHLNYPQLLTTELLASGCRDRILAAIREHPRLCGMDVDWERLIDFPHGSLRLMGSKKAPWMDSDPAWVAQQVRAVTACRVGTAAGEACGVAPSCMAATSGSKVAAGTLSSGYAPRG